MRYEQMPDDCLKRFRVRCYPLGMDDRNEDADIRESCSVTAVPADDADNGRAYGFRVIQCRNDIPADITLDAPATDRKHQNRIALVEPADLQPIREYRLPPLVIGPRSEFRNIVGGSIGFDSSKLSEVVHGM